MLKKDSINFIKGLEDNNLTLIKNVPKSDLHCHLTLSSNHSFFEIYSKKKIPPFYGKIHNFAYLEKYISKYYKPILQSKKGFEYIIKSSFIQAKKDNIIIYSPTIDCWHIKKYTKGIKEFVNTLKNIHNEIAPNITFIPTIGMRRERGAEKYKSIITDSINSGFFKYIDLTGNENINNLSEFKKIFTIARKNGMLLKAHIGETSTPDKVKETIEILELDEIQHGISISTSKNVMQFIKNNNIQLNVCPTSNIFLGYNKLYKEHPIRKLYDFGLKITINTDDIALFNKSVSEEYLDLFNNEIFTSNELNNIRINSIKNKT